MKEIESEHQGQKQGMTLCCSTWFTNWFMGKKKTQNSGNAQGVLTGLARLPQGRHFNWHLAKLITPYLTVNTI